MLASACRFGYRFECCRKADSSGLLRVLQDLCQLSSVVEQRFRKAWVLGSIPRAGSTQNPAKTSIKKGQKRYCRFRKQSRLILPNGVQYRDYWQPMSTGG